MEGDNQFSGSIFDAVGFRIIGKSESEILIQSARAQDSHLRAVLPPKEHRTPAKAGKKPVTKGSKSSKKGRKASPLRVHTARPEISIKGSRLKKSPVSSRYNTQDMEDNDEAEQMEILEQLRLNEEEQARIAVEMAKRQKAQRDRVPLYR